MQTTTQVKCCPKCSRESSSSGISRHRQTCKEYRLFTTKRQEFSKQVADAKKARRAQYLHAQQQERPENMLTDDTVSFSSGICLQKYLTHYRYLSCHLRVRPLRVPCHCQGVPNESGACQPVIRTYTQSRHLQPLYLLVWHLNLSPLSQPLNLLRD